MCRSAARPAIAADTRLGTVRLGVGASLLLASSSPSPQNSLLR
jgi:hypothetical protein